MSRSIELFNGLNGKEVTREELEKISNLLIVDEQTHVHNRLQKVLANNENKLFRVTLEEEAFEVVPASMLNGLQFDDINEISFDGLNKAVSADEIYQNITDLMINTIKEVGFLPWQKEWKGTGLPTARNYVTEQPYTGINAVTLPYDVKIVNGKTVLIQPKHKDVYYLTFNQITKLGATLKKGSKARRVEYFNFAYNYLDFDKKLKFTTTNASDFSKFVKKNKLSESEVEENTSKYPILKYYNVFKSTDCENLPEKEPKILNAEPIEIAEKVIELYPNSPKITIGKEDRAFYRGGYSDEVFMPNISAFSNESYYYSTFFHELVHSTGHESRLKRDLTGRFGSSKYAFEELVAELGAVFLCAETGILFNTIENSAKYLKGWNKRLIGKMKEDNKFFFRASAMAQKGVNLILDLDKNREPKYRKEFSLKANETPIKLKSKKVEDNPKGFDKKPKSVSVATAVKDILTTGKYKGLKSLQAGLIFSTFKNDVNKEIEEASKYQSSIFIKLPDYLDFYSDAEKNLYDVSLTELGKEFIKSVNGRQESLKNQKYNLSLFDGLKGISRDLDTIAYNKELIKAIKRGVKPTDGFVLGFPKGILKDYMNDFQISLSGKVLKKAIAQTKDHNLNFGNFIDLPDFLNNPVAIFKSKSIGYTVLTEIKDTNKKPVLVALHIDSKRKSSKIASMYVRENYNTYKTWIKENLHLYINKKSELFTFAQATIAVGGKNSLDKVIKKTTTIQKNNKKGLSEPILTEEILIKKEPVLQIGNIKPISQTGKSESEFFNVKGEIGKFLQAVEKKPFESVVITLDGEQGAGKTTTLYNFIDAFASAGNKSLFISGEEHPESSLAVEKRDKYLSNEALQNTSIVGEVENVEQLYKYIDPFDIVFIDSWQKLQRMVGNIRLDEDLRKKFNGKVFVIIFQQTTTGRTKGGAEVVYDGDIIIKMVKEKSFADNYAFFDKNRYTKIPIENIRLNIATAKTYNPNEAIEDFAEKEIENSFVNVETVEPLQLSFEVN